MALPMSSFTGLKPGWKSSWVYLKQARVSIPPAHPMNIWPSSSESRLINVLPVKKPLSIPKAPSIPVSSEIVNTHSILPIGRSLSSKASIAAIPIPSSAPRVVSLAIIQPSSTQYSIGSFRKSWLVPLLFSHTMSWCPWSTSVGTLSFPAEASFTMQTLPILSVLHSRFLSLANCCRYAVIGSS